MLTACRRFTTVILDLCRWSFQLIQSFRNATECFRNTTPPQNQRRPCGLNTLPRSLQNVVEELRPGKTAEECIEIFSNILARIFQREELSVGLLTRNDDGWPRWMTAGNTTAGQLDDHCNLESHTKELWCEFLSRSSPSAVIHNDNPTIEKYELSTEGSGSSHCIKHCYRIGDYAALVIVMPATSTWSQLQESHVSYVLREFALRLRQLEVKTWAWRGAENSKSTLLTSRAYEVQSASAYFMAELCNSPISVAFMDLDNFKNLNSKLTHLEADKVLLCVGEMIKEVLSNYRNPGRVVAGHIGGDEFMFTIIGNEEFAKSFMTDVLKSFQNLRPKFSKQEFNEKFDQFKQSPGFSASVGIATWRWDADSSIEDPTTDEDKIKQIKLAMEENAGRANETLLKAKESKAENSGGNVVFYNELEK